MSLSDLERRLRMILFESRANDVEDILDPALQAEAGFLALQVKQQRAALKAARAEETRLRFARGRAGAVARRREQRDRKARAAHQLRALGLSNREIARRLDVCRRHVSRLVNEYEAPADLPRCAQCGQPLSEENS
jgi:CRP-like cAMP-binding protein